MERFELIKVNWRVSALQLVLWPFEAGFDRLTVNIENIKETKDKKDE